MGATEEQIVNCLGRVRIAAASMIRLAPPSLSIDDLISTGNWALVMAARRYENNTPDLWCYATYFVKGTMKREIHSQYRERTRFAELDTALNLGSAAKSKPKKQMSGRAANQPSLVEALLGEPCEKDSTAWKLARAAVNALERERRLVLTLYYDELIPTRAIGLRFGTSGASALRLRDSALCEARQGLVTPQRAAELCKALHEHKLAA